jgi:drug/metabolite transporter (DMT)-like permease
MAITVPMGVVLFLLVAVVSGEIFRWTQYPARAAAWMAGVGLVHFIFGRYCNYKANQVAGVNLTAPVVQLQVIVTLVFAVVILKEPCTVLQMIGGALILAGSFLTQRQPATRRNAGKAPVFVPRYFLGYLFASLAALGYGTSPIMARFALADTGPMSGILGGLIAYGAATAFVAVALLWPPVRRDVTALKRENLPWFAYSGLFVALAQGFFYAAVAVAPIMLVMPILQMSLVFRLIISTWLNPDHEVFGPIVIMGAAISLIGSLTVAVDTEFILSALSVPDALGQLLRWRI